MVTIVIAGINYESYLSLQDADDFLGGDLTLNALWLAVPEAARSQALVTATRWTDQQTWQGERVSQAQALDWPRTGVSVEGHDVSSASIPQDILDGVATLAALLVEDNAILESSTTGSNIKLVVAGSAEVEFFRSTSGTKFPDQVQRYIGAYLEAFGELTYNLGSLAFGTRDADGVIIPSDIPTQGSFLRNSGLG